jgi:hypothetical protein
LPLNLSKPFKKHFYSISSTIKKLSYFKTNIIFEPVKLTKKKSLLIGSNRDILSYFLNYFYENNINNEEERNLLGIFNFYFNNKILIYQIVYSNFLEVLSHIGGIVKILFFIFEMLNYINHNYTVIENTKDLFKISSGLDSTFINSKEINFENMRHATTKFKIRQMTNEENKKIYSPKITKNKLKLDHKGLSPKAKLSKKNNFALYPINITSNKRNKLSKKNTNSFKVVNNKRNSTLSQGYRVKSKDNKENSIYIKNQSYWDNDENSINEIPSSGNYNENENNSNYFNSNSKENNVKLLFSKKNNNEYNIKKYQKANLKLSSNKHIIEKEDKNSHLYLKTHNRVNNLRHKSINYSNEKKLLRNSIFNKIM